MSSYRTYNVVLKDEQHTVLKINADDVNMTSEGEHDDSPWFNFYVDDDREDGTTVAAIPYKNVLYINS